MMTSNDKVQWQPIMFILGVVALIAALAIGYFQLKQAEQISNSNQNFNATQVSLQHTQVSYLERLNEGNSPLATSVEELELEAGLATVEAQIHQVALTATQSARLTQTAIAGVPIYDVSNADYSGLTINELIEQNQLVCVTTGPIRVSTSVDTLQFTGIGRGSIVCWIGAQFAQASGLNGYTSIKHVDLQQGDPVEVANELISQWAIEMTTRSDGCGASYGPCDATDIALILADGSIIRK